MTPDKAFILAAGYGKRLRPHTDTLPKPLVRVRGTAMIDSALDKLTAMGVRECVINTHYLAETLHDHLATRQNPHITISHEPELLDTGGGIKNALQHFDAPFFVLSGDSVWEDTEGETALQMLAQNWDSQKMDILILLQPVSSMKLTHGVGDYDLLPDGRALRSKDQSGEYMFTSSRINTPQIFADTPNGAFSYLDLLDKAEANGRLYGLVHHGMWHHISTPDDLEAVNKANE